jgi:epoxyqueuosine reductase
MTLSFTNGEKYRLIRKSILEELETEIQTFQSTVHLNSFQKWIVNELYDFTPPEADFTVKSILLVAIPHPLFSKVTFQYDHRQYHCVSLVSSDFERTRNTVHDELTNDGFHFLEAKNLPLKRLAVQSGLAIYGRNNITYIDGLGSCFSYMAFFTDLSPETVSLLPVKVSKVCENCTACIRNCPTGAIQRDSFLIDNQKCLSCLNETGDPFPDWVPVTAHHSLYDCIKCQVICPMNKDQKDSKGRDVHFTEEEILILLEGTPFSEYPQALKEKGRYLGLDQWPGGIAKNLWTLIERKMTGV